MNSQRDITLKLKHEPYMYDMIRVNTLPPVYHIVYQLTTEVYKYSTVDYIEEQIIENSGALAKRRKEAT